MLMALQGFQKRPKSAFAVPNPSHPKSSPYMSFDHLTLFNNVVKADDMDTNGWKKLVL